MLLVSWLLASLHNPFNNLSYHCCVGNLVGCWIMMKFRDDENFTTFPGDIRLGD
jgi:hypothetical protein